MKVVAVVSQKGGVGKTTVTVSQIVLAALGGYRVLAIDLDDVQRTCATFFERREEFGAGSPDVRDRINCVRASMIDLPMVMSRAGGFDFVFIDTKAAAEEKALAAVRAADIILIPTRPDSIYDLDSISTTIALAATEQKRFFVLFNHVPPKRSDASKETESGMTGSGIAVAPVRLVVRDMHKDAASEMLTPFEKDPAHKAAKETKALFAWLCQELQVPVAKAVARAA